MGKPCLKLFCHNVQFMVTLISHKTMSISVLHRWISHNALYENVFAKSVVLNFTQNNVNKCSDKAALDI